MTAHLPLPKTTTDWQPYAAAVISRLRQTQHTHPKPHSPIEFDGAFDGCFDAPKPHPASSMADQLEAILASSTSSADGPGLAEVPALPALDVETLMLVLQLASAFGTAEGFQKTLQPGALTMIRGFAMRRLDTAEKVLREGFLPDGWTVLTEARVTGAGSDTLLCLSPDVRDGIVSKHALSQFAESVGTALSMPHPLVMLVPDALDLPATISACRPETLELPGMDKDRLIFLLRQSVADWSEDDATLCRALPGDGLIAGLSGPALASALRLPRAGQIVERLSTLVRPANSGPRLEEIAGDGAALTAAKALMADLQLWRSGSLPWQEMRHSMLMHGAPGTGKTWLARAMGNTPGIGFVTASFPNWQAQGHLGDMLAAMRASFAQAVQCRPSVFLVDEVDAVGSRVSSDRHAEGYRGYVITGFLQQIDMLMQKEGVLLIGACNFLNRLDPAITRPGRFDLVVEMPQPTAAGLYNILSGHFPIGFEDKALRDLATRAVGASAAEMDGAARAAKGVARASNRTVGLSDLETSLALGATYAAADWRVAIHEIGHVLICALLRLGQIERVALTRDGGETMRRVRALETTQQGIADEICHTLGGRAAEILIFGAASGGSGGLETSDLALATRLALWLDTKFGLGAFGPVWFDAPDATFLRDPDIQARVRQRIESAEQRAIALLYQNRSLLNAMAELLLLQREMSMQEVAGWLVQITEAAAPD